MSKRYGIQFPRDDSRGLGQDEAYFYLLSPDGKEKIRFHEYGRIYERPGLYEQLFYDRLKCKSPRKVSEALLYAVRQENQSLPELRVLDLGAGNGMMGEALADHGVSRLVGVDIIPEARDAAERDRPGIYDEYIVCDLTDLESGCNDELAAWSFDCLTTVAALGFGDIPTSAFINAVNLVHDGGWVAFNIKETFLDRSDESGFSRLTRELIFSEYMHLYHLERYRHRLSIDGAPLYYFAVVVRKDADIPLDFL